MSSITRHEPLLVLLVFFLFSHCLLVSEGRRRTPEIRKYYPEEPPIKTIVLENGDVFDCIDFYSQPAMKHAFIRRNAQVIAKFPPQRTITTGNESDQKLKNGDLDENGSKNRSCPLGSIPILKATKAGPLNLSAINDFKRSSAKLFLGSETIKIEDDDKPEDHEYAVMKVKYGDYTGAVGNINIWQPLVESITEISLSQLWIVRRVDNNVASLEAGWVVHPALFGDHLTRFFVFTTNDTYKSTLYCDYDRNPTENNHLQFVTEANVHLPLGSQLSSSVYDGDQTEFQIRIERNDHGNWDLFVDDRKIGFWPRENYNDGFPLANDVQWGGEIVNDGSRERHTSTQMGSGKFSRAGTGKAAYISKVALYDKDNRYYEIPEPVSLFSTKKTCYDVTYWGCDDEFGCHMTMGGPGYDKNRCP